MSKRVELWAGYADAILVGAALIVRLIAYVVYRTWG
jgi:hypothetical protein